MQTISCPKRSDLHIARKLWHAGVGFIALYSYYTFDGDAKAWALLTFVLGTLALLLDILRLRSPELNTKYMAIFRPFMRASERDGITGFPFYAFGASFALYFYSEKIALLSLFFLIFADPISSVVGILHGKDKLLPNKSVQGSAACFIVCYLVTVFYCLASGTTSIFNLFFFAIFAGLFGMVAELLSAFGIDDNLTIPIVSGFGLTLVHFLFPVF